MHIRALLEIAMKLPSSIVPCLTLRLSYAAERALSLVRAVHAAAAIGSVRPACLAEDKIRKIRSKRLNVPSRHVRAWRLGVVARSSSFGYSYRTEEPEP